MKIISTLGFAVPTPNGIIPASTSVAPKVLIDGTVENLPAPVEGAVILVNAFVMAAAGSTRPDLVMFNPALTVRDEQNKVIAQGGFINHAGTPVG